LFNRKNAFCFLESIKRSWLLSKGLTHIDWKTLLDDELDFFSLSSKASEMRGITLSDDIIDNIIVENVENIELLKKDVLRTSVEIEKTCNTTTYCSTCKSSI